ncbi:Maltose acetyltransferase [Aspergillus nanangensis]|uniref:Maltose acetyltransferase n=1 Tax=Aspergillus nanangensis TaxID=2582783 RepID=A0AAD4CEK7_ASPNN|nr:Maltose acetyltransferase [Aspergillus nanangensis]
MTAVSPVPVMNDHEPEKEPKADHSPSRFTAVNGKDSSISGPSLNNGEHHNAPESWGKGRSDEPSSHHDEGMRENGNSGGNDIERSSQSSPHAGASASSKNKRKRSESLEQNDNVQLSYRGPRSPSHPEDLTDSDMQQETHNGVESSFVDHDPQTASSASAQPKLPENQEARPSSSSTAWHEYDSQLVTQAQQRAQQIDPSDAQLAEVLQREAQGHDATQKGWLTSNRIREGTVPNEPPPSLSTFSQERPQQVAPKRKRVFSNRTKTGCMTCRRRKKKCDEQHPACNNCIRGGFLCEGYSSRSTWQKPSSTKAPVPLQSKEGYADLSNQYVHEINQNDRPQSLSEQLDAGKIRPIVVDDNERSTTQFNSSPTGVGSNRGSWSKRTWPSTSHSAYVSEHATKPDYREVPSIHELPRDGHPKPDYPIVPPIRELSHGPHGKPGIPLFQGSLDQRPSLTTTNAMDTNSPQAQARMALSIEHQLSARTVPSEETEKEKMVRGELYRPFDIHLVEERERCKAALWRFNNSCNPVSGLSTKEQNRLLKEVFVPPTGIDASPSGVTPPRSAGSIGQGAVVEPPFNCHYGYNIHIGEDVLELLFSVQWLMQICKSAKVLKVATKAGPLPLKKTAMLEPVAQYTQVFAFDVVLM